MHELNGNVLGIGRGSAPAKCKQPSSTRKPVRHLAAGEREPGSFAREEVGEKRVAFEQRILNLGGGR